MFNNSSLSLSNFSNRFKILWVFYLENQLFRNSSWLLSDLKSYSSASIGEVSISLMKILSDFRGSKKKKNFLEETIKNFYLKLSSISAKFGKVGIIDSINLIRSSFLK